MPFQDENGVFAISQVIDTMSSVKNWLANGLLVLFGIAMGFLILQIALPLLAGNDDGRPRNLNIGEIQYRAGMGDLFEHQGWWITPPDDPYVVLSEHELRWDEDGFRVPAQPAEEYAVLALGDSFTEGSNVALPWPDVLAAESGLPTRNMGFRGYGPVEQSIIMQEYSATADPDFVVIGFFEGNDLSNAVSFEGWRGQEFDLPALAREIFVDDGWTTDSWTFEHDHPGPFRYPMRLNIDGDDTVEIAFFEPYLWNLNVATEDIAQDEALNITANAWQEIDAVTDACVVIMYLPTKGHIYAPYIIEEHRPHLMDERSIGPASAGNVDFALQDQSFDAVMSRLGNTRDAVAARAEQEGFLFFDMTPIMQSAVSATDPLFYLYDTHPNQAGHDLIGRSLADYLTQQDSCTA
jgi:hypothetical protein